mgnify:CR=1 FL=1
MFGKKADDKIAKKQAEQEAKDKAAMEKFGVDFDSYTSEDIKKRMSHLLKKSHPVLQVQKCILSEVF